MSQSLVQKISKKLYQPRAIYFCLTLIVGLCLPVLAQNSTLLSNRHPASPESSEFLETNRPKASEAKQILYTEEDLAAREAVLRQRSSVSQAGLNHNGALFKTLIGKAQFHEEDNQDSPSGSNQIGFGTAFQANGLHVNDITGEVRLELPVLGDGILIVAPVARNYHNPNKLDVTNQAVGPFGWGTAGIGPVNDRLWGHTDFDQNGNSIGGLGYYEYWENGVKSYFYKDHLFTDWDPSEQVPTLNQDPNPGRHYVDKQLNRLEVFPPGHEYSYVIRKTNGVSIYFKEHPLHIKPVPFKITFPTGSTLWVFHEKNDIDGATGLERRLLYRDDYGRELIAYLEEGATYIAHNEKARFIKKIVMKDSSSSQEVLLGTFHRDAIDDLIAFETPEGYRTELEWYQLIYDGNSFRRSELHSIKTAQKGTIDIEYDFFDGDSPRGGRHAFRSAVRRVKKLNLHNKVKIDYDYTTHYKAELEDNEIVQYPYERVVVKESLAVDSQQAIKETTKYHAGLLFSYDIEEGTASYLAGNYHSGRPFHKVTTYTAKSGERSTKTEKWEWKPFHAWTNRDTADSSSWRPSKNSNWELELNCGACSPPVNLKRYIGGYGFCLPRLKTYSFEKDGQWTDIDYEYRFDHDELTQTNRDFDFQNELLAPSKITKRLRSHPGNYSVTELSYQKIASMGLQRDQASGESIYRLDLPTSRITTTFIDLQIADVQQETHAYDAKGRLLASKYFFGPGSQDFLSSEYQYYSDQAGGTRFTSNYRGNLLKTVSSTSPTLDVVDYQYGKAATVRFPIGPDMLTSYDLLGNAISTTINGVTTVYDYDRDHRLIQTDMEGRFPLKTQYSASSWSGQGAFAIDWMDDGVRQRWKTVRSFDALNRPYQVDTVIDSRENLKATQKAYYSNGLDAVRFVQHEDGSHSYQFSDAYGRVIRAERKKNGAVLEKVFFSYETSASGEVTVTRRRVDAQNHTDILIKRYDFLGREIYAATNPPNTYPADLDTTGDYLLGGHTDVAYTFDPVTRFTQATVSPYGTQRAEEKRITWRDALGRTVKTKDPEYQQANDSIVHYFEYNASNLLVFESLENQQRSVVHFKHRFSYDALNRLTSKDSLVQGQWVPLARWDYDSEKNTLVRAEAFGQGDQSVISQLGGFDAQNRATQFSTSVSIPVGPNQAYTHVEKGISQVDLFWPDVGFGDATNQFNIRIRPTEYLDEPNPDWDLVFANIPWRAGENAIRITRQTLLSKIQSQLSGTLQDTWLSYVLAQGNSELVTPDLSFSWQVQAIHPKTLNVSESTPWLRFNPLPDLTMNGVSATQVYNRPDHNYRLDFTTVNLGEYPSSATQIRITLAATPSGGNALLIRDSLELPALAVGFGETYSEQVMIRPEDRLIDQTTGLPIRNYLIFEVDAPDLVKEGGREANNRKVFFLGTGGSLDDSKPDLQVRNMDHIYIYTGGGTWDAYGVWDILNSTHALNGLTAPPSTTQVYVSNQNYLGDASQEVVGRVNTPLLGRNSLVTQAQFLYETQTVYQVAQKFLLVEADKDNDVTPEGNETNNLSHFTLAGLDGSGPDLVLAAVRHDGFEAGSATIDGFEVKVQNRGSWVSEICTIRLYFSNNNSTYDPENVVDYADIRVPKLEPGETSPFIPGIAVKLYVPGEFQVGNNYVFVVIDPDNEVAEGPDQPNLGENNNVRTVSFDGFSDLQMESVQINYADRSLVFEISNQGNAPSPVNRVNFYSDPGVGAFSLPGPTFETQLAIPVIAPGETITLNSPSGWQVPLSTNDQTIWVFADPLNDVLELDETNNVMGVPVPAASPDGPQPDLFPMIHLGRGGWVFLGYGNSQTTGTATPWLFRVVLSKDPQLDETDQVLWQVDPYQTFNEFIPGIDGEAIENRVFTWKIWDWYRDMLARLEDPIACPTGCPELSGYVGLGDVYLIASVDHLNSIPESPEGETNNALVKHIRTYWDWHTPDQIERPPLWDQEPTGKRRSESKPLSKTQMPLASTKTKPGGSSTASMTLPIFQMNQFTNIAENTYEIQFQLRNPSNKPLTIQNLSFFLEKDLELGLAGEHRLVYTQAVGQKGPGLSGGSTTHTDRITTLEPGQTLPFSQILSYPAGIDKTQFSLTLYTDSAWRGTNGLTTHATWNGITEYLDFTPAQRITHLPQTVLYKGAKP